MKQYQKKLALERVIHGVFLLLGLVTVGCVLLITIYLIVSGIPATRKIGLVPFLFGKVWASTSKTNPQYGILPFILTSVYGTAGAIVLGVPIGFFYRCLSCKACPAAAQERPVVGCEPAFRHSLGRLRPCRHAGFGSRYPQALSDPGRRESACGHHCACHHDPAVHHQSFRHRARGCAQRV